MPVETGLHELPTEDLIPTPKLHELLTKDLIPTEDNKRKVDPNSPDILELTQSVKEVGVLQPVLVRPHPQKAGKWDLRAGHRRLVAARLADLETIPAIVADLDDRRAAEITTVENLQREDLSPIEEAEQLQVMIDAGWDMGACAVSIGKDLAWVHSRARISKLIPEFKEFELDDGRLLYEAWSIAHLEMIARYPENTQKEIFAIFERRHYVPDLGDLRGTIGRLTNELDKASFDPEDLELVPEATCPDCPKRRGHHPDLFQELGPSIPLKEDVCLDPECYAMKSRVHGENVLKKAQEKDDRTVAVAKMPYHDEYQKPGSTSYMTDYRPAKKADRGAIPAVVVGGEGKIGRKVWVKPTSGSGSSSSTKTGKKTLAEKKTALEQRRMRHARAAMWEKIEKMEAAPKKPLTWYGQMIAAGAYDRGFERWNAADMAAAKNKDLLEHLWTGIWQGLEGYPLFDVNDREIPPRKQKELEVLGNELGISWKDLVAAAVEAIPVPKAWAEEEAAKAKASSNGQAKKARTKKTPRKAKKTKRTRKVTKKADRS